MRIRIAVQLQAARFIENIRVVIGRCHTKQDVVVHSERLSASLMGNRYLSVHAPRGSEDAKKFLKSGI
jgi:hypothetical protein